MPYSAVLVGPLNKDGSNVDIMTVGAFLDSVDPNDGNNIFVALYSNRRHSGVASPEPHGLYRSTNAFVGCGLGYLTN